MKPTAWPDFEDVRGARLLVALSGGADSTALLAMLVGARKRLELHLAAAHVNHSIRGPESRADAEFCEKLCRELNVDFYLKPLPAACATTRCARCAPRPAPTGSFWLTIGTIRLRRC